MTNFTKKSFTVASPGTSSYADNWERTFRGPKTTHITPAEDPTRLSQGVTFPDLHITSREVNPYASTPTLTGSRFGQRHIMKGIRRLRTDVRTLPFDWIGPWPADLTDGYDAKLKVPVPPERWPYGSPLQHEPVCLLQKNGLYCDCKASSSDEPDWGYVL